MLGAIAGDIVGSSRERKPVKTTQFPLFPQGSRVTDDSILTIAVAQAILSGGFYLQAIHGTGRNYPHAGYGARFTSWLRSSDPVPYNSWGNGSAMRVAPVGFAFHTGDEVLRQAQLSAEISHNHPEGIKGAQAVALSIFMARTGATKSELKAEIIQRFGYDLDRKLDQIRPHYTFDVSCAGSVPESIICFLEADSWEGAVRNAVSLGGDSDTMACMAGAIAEACFGPLPESIQQKVRAYIPVEMLPIVDRFYQTYMPSHPSPGDSSGH
jgi:ADP-ribosylglycohydrolase